MSEMDEQQLEQVMRRVLNEKRKVDENVHAKHHRYIDILLEREERHKERWRKFHMSFIGGLGLAALGFLGWLGKLMWEVFRHGPPPGPHN